MSRDVKTPDEGEVVEETVVSDWVAEDMGNDNEEEEMEDQEVITTETTIEMEAGDDPLSFDEGASIDEEGVMIVKDPQDVITLQYGAEEVAFSPALDQQAGLIVLPKLESATQVAGNQTSLQSLTVRLADRCIESGDVTVVSMYEDGGMLMEDVGDVSISGLGLELETEEGVAAYCDVEGEEEVGSGLDDQQAGAVAGDEHNEFLLNLEPEQAVRQAEDPSGNGTVLVYHCMFCPKTFDLRNSWKNHVKSHSKVRPYACQTCNKKFKKIGDKERHMKVCGLDLLPRECPECGKRFSGHNALSNHVKTHSMEKPFSCSYCTMSFKKHGDRNNHERICLSGELPFACPYCDRRFAGANNLSNHISVHTGQSRIFTCGTCKKQFKKLGSHRKHEEHCRLGLVLACPDCDKKFTNAMALERHKRIHSKSEDKPIKCDECDKTFTHKNGFANHKKSHQPQSIQCGYEDCPGVFSSPTDFKRHLTVHKEDRPANKEARLVCDICNKKFNDAWNCRRHRETHSGVKAYKCVHCDKRFVYEKDMLNHMFTHSGQKPFQCDQCEASFTHLRGLQGHINIHADNGKAVACAHCRKKFVSRSACRAHLDRCRSNPDSEANRRLRERFGSQQAVDGDNDDDDNAGQPSDDPLEDDILVFRCKICDRQFDDYQDIQNHIFVHKKETENCANVEPDKVVISIEVKGPKEEKDEAIDEA